jgi:hypothetical protein
MQCENLADVQSTLPMGRAHRSDKERMSIATRARDDDLPGDQGPVACRGCQEANMETNTRTQFVVLQASL